MASSTDVISLCFKLILPIFSSKSTLQSAALASEFVKTIDQFISTLEIISGRLEIYQMYATVLYAKSELVQRVSLLLHRTTPTIEVSPSAIEDDIRHFVHQKVYEDEAFLHIGPILRETIVETLVQGANRMFSLPFMQLSRTGGARSFYNRGGLTTIKKRQSDNRGVLESTVVVNVGGQRAQNGLISVTRRGCRRERWPVRDYWVNWSSARAFRAASNLARRYRWKP
ncbi:hypothetical protein C8J56DRAFT_1037747 [Mycena floridula]|nr:hypothetical protein C8J56DRAFT_1037747 [Mycena floridula]